MSGKRYIIGGGLSGLIFAYYNPEYTVITSSAGGVFGDSNFSGVIVLHDTPENRNLLEDLSLPIVQRPVLILSLVGGDILHSSQVRREERNKIRLKKMITHDRYPKTDFTKDLETGSLELSTDRDILPTLEVEPGELVTELVKRVTIKNGCTVTQIKDTSLTYTRKGAGTEEVEFDHLVSTLPAPIFWSIYEGAQEAAKNMKRSSLKMEAATVVKSGRPPLENEPDEDFFLYIPDPSVPYVRCKKRQGVYFYEFTGELPVGMAGNLFDGDVRGVTTIPYARISDDLSNFPPSPFISFLGRFSTWRHRDLIHDVVRFSRAKFDFGAMVMRQAAFNAHFFDYNNMSLEERQRWTKELVLCGIDEFTELLRETNWKHHRGGGKEVSRERILEELIDCLKFTLGIANVWGMTPYELITAFHQKSDKVDTRYKNEHNE